MTPLDIVLLKKLVEFEIILYLFEKQYSNQLNICHYIIPI